MSDIEFALAIPTGMVLAYFSTFLLYAICNMIAGRILGEIVFRFRVLCFEIVREMIPEGKYKFRFNHFRIMTIVDMGKLGGSNNSRITDKEEKIMMILSVVFFTFISAGIYILTSHFLLREHKYLVWERMNFGKMTLLTCATLISVSAAIYIMIIIVVVLLGYNMFFTNGLVGFYKKKYGEIQTAGKISCVKLPPLLRLDLFSFENEKILYQNLRMTQAIYVGDMATMGAIANWVAEKKKSTTSRIEPLYMNVLFYFSHYCQNIPNADKMAKKYFKKVKVELQKGIDANDKRIYAYYMYYIEHNEEEALRLANEGLKLLPRYPKDIPELWEGEQKWLDHLIEEIHRNAATTPYSI